MNDLLVALLVLLISVVLILAQLRLFSIDSTLKKMLEILREQADD